MTQQTVFYLLFTTTILISSSFVSSTKLLYNGTADVESKTLIQTKSGPVSGLITVRSGINVSCYLGIPYAEPPLGERRFAEPSAVKSWKKTYHAVRQSPICYQREWNQFKPTHFQVVRELMKEDATIEDFYATHKDEDCLYLSIFTRTVPHPKTVAKNKTTLVWIHGGAFISGTANMPFHTFAFMVANDPNLVVVAINYRLNVFGFLTTGTKSMPGNLGLKDQILALRWIRANIGAFGGDAKKVVLWGQSAGAVSIGYHMMSRKSGDSLFKRAILESGNPLLPLTLATPSYRQNAFIDFLGKVNCSTADSIEDSVKWIDANWAKKLLPCLRAKTTKDIFDEYQEFAQHTPLAFLPNAEDKSLFAFSSFWKGVRSGAFSFSGDILIGTNEAEGAQYVKIGPLESFYSKHEISPNFTRDNVLAKLSSFAPENLRSMVEPVFEVLADGVEDVNNSTQIWQRYVQLVGDMVFVCPDFYFLKGYMERQASNRRKVSPSSKVFYYRFRPKVSQPVDCPSWAVGACHTDELQFVFGNPLLLSSQYPPEEQLLSRAMFTTFLDFAHGSSLSSGKSTNVSFSQRWRPFTMDNPEYLQIDMAEAKMVKGFPGQRCEELCEPLYEMLESMDDSQMKLIKTKVV